MSAVVTKAWADLLHRRLQSIVIVVVIVLTSGAAILALNLLVETDAPFDHAFANANGAHLIVSFDAAKVTEAQLRATANVHGVTETAGPWPEVSIEFALPFPPAGRIAPKPAAGSAALPSTPHLRQAFFDVVGRDRPDTNVDRLTMEAGRWVRAPGEIVISQRIADGTDLRVGAQITALTAPGQPALTVVGIAASISRATDAWVLPGQISALSGQGAPLHEQMQYRVSPAGTSDQLRTATQAIAAAVPNGAFEGVQTYLDVKTDADVTTGVMTPFLLAFSAFALVASAFIIANIVAGIVIASYREIGIMKSIGFAPRQVSLILIGQILGPVLLGCLIGIPIGTIASQPFLRKTAHALSLPTSFTVSLPMALIVSAAIVLIAVLSALLPAWRAGELSAVDAIARGTAPASQRGAWLSRLSSRLPLPRAVTLGIGDSFARPLRSAMTIGAIAVGVATVIFGVGLHDSLGQVQGALIRNTSVQADVRRRNPVTDQQVVSLLRATTSTERFVAEAQGAAVVPGIAEPIPYIGYRGDASWLGFALIKGRWFSNPGEVVAPTKFLDQAHLKVGDRFTAQIDGRPVQLRLVGEILDVTDNDLLLRGDWGPLAVAGPGAVQPTDYDIQVARGISAQDYVRQLMDNATAQGLDKGFDAGTVGNSNLATTFLLFNTVIAGLAVILTAIAVAGVFNTVTLNTRERIRDIAILKAVGMAPNQVVAMTVGSVVLLGLIAGGVGIPLGLALHRHVLILMGHIASGTAIPPAFFDVFGHGKLVVLALSGVAIAAIGAWIPARWAASHGVAGVLQSE